MKKLLFAFIFTMVGIASIQAQGVKIRWEDDKGREFAITAPSGSLSYGMLPGDHVSYNINGQVSKVGDVYISYNVNGQVSRVGDVYISYDVNGRVSKVGGMYISYNIYGQISSTSGQVRRKKSSNPYDSYGW